MSEIVKICKVHGELTIDKVSKTKDAKLKLGFCYKCKECTSIAVRKRPCSRHGELNDSERIPSGYCRYCCMEGLKRANIKRDTNREWFNEKQRIRREADPEKCKEIYRDEYKRRLAAHGNEAINTRQKTSARGIKPCDLKEMIDKQENKCAICKQLETRVFSKKGDGFPDRITSLCIDHNHSTNKVRELLCHACNTGIGKFKENINLLQSAIDYLRKHNYASS